MVNLTSNQILFKLRIILKKLAKKEKSCAKKKKDEIDNVDLSLRESREVSQSRERENQQCKSKDYFDKQHPEIEVKSFFNYSPANG
jgi:hypothetical protein